MILSMTGFGKAERISQNRKFTVEVRSLNGKNCDVSVKSSFLPREADIEIRQYVAKHLMRGNIDIFLTEENTAGEQARQIDADIFLSYCRQLKELADKAALPQEQRSDMLSAVLRLPDVVSAEKNELDEADMDAIRQALSEAVQALTGFRTREGEVLKADLVAKVDKILHLLEEAETFEKERTESIRQRIVSRLEELQVAVDKDRLEQEMIYYLEKLDVNEEKVRLRQHCSYFLSTMEQEACPGRKLGFIAQEMGREINTLGSKSNHAGMQKCVVRMKDELEKIKEQVLNVL